MRIGEAAKRAELPEKTLRYYDALGLICCQRSNNGYRSYQQQQIKELVFIRRARHFGFSLKDCEKLLLLLRNNGRQSHTVHELACEKLEAMNQHITELVAMRDELSHLINHCANDEQAGCAIIEGMSGGEPL